MTQDSLYEKLYGKPQPNPDKEQEVEQEPNLKARSGRAFLESLKNEQHPRSTRRTESNGGSD